MQEITFEEWENRIGYHKPTEESIELHKEIREQIIGLGEWLVANLPPSREKSLALTHLQEASMWSNAAVACNLSPLARGE